MIKINLQMVPSNNNSSLLVSNLGVFDYDFKRVTRQATLKIHEIHGVNIRPVYKDSKMHIIVFDNKNHCLCWDTRIIPEDDFNKMINNSSAVKEDFTIKYIDSSTYRIPKTPALTYKYISYGDKNKLLSIYICLSNHVVIDIIPQIIYNILNIIAHITSNYELISITDYDWLSNY